MAKSFYRQREGPACRNSTVSFDSHLKIVLGSLTSGILIVLSIVKLQFQSWFDSVSSIQILRTVAASVMAMVWSLCG